VPGKSPAESPRRRDKEPASESGRYKMCGDSKLLYRLDAGAAVTKEKSAKMTWRFFT
jgi:hypothetical protein